MKVFLQKNRKKREKLYFKKFHISMNDYKKALEPFAEEIVNRYNRNVDLGKE